MRQEPVDQLAVRAAPLDPVTVAGQDNTQHGTHPPDSCRESAPRQPERAGPQTVRACPPAEGRLTWIFFGIITRQAIRRGSFTSVRDLITAIETFVDGWNDRCQPFTWTETAEELLPRCRPGKRTSFTRH